MRIESQSLPSYLKSQGVSWDVSNTKEEWKKILMFPDEDWTIDRGSAYGGYIDSQEQTILDPSRVLARMLCVKIDRALRLKVEKLAIKCIQGLRKEGSYRQVAFEEKQIPFSWILRIAHDGDADSWDPGDFLVYAKLEGGDELKPDIEEIRSIFPKLFDGKDLETSGVRNDSVRAITDVFNENYPLFLERPTLHISAPKFHKVWSKMIGDEDKERTEEGEKAKRQWSMRVNGLFEKLCRNSSSDSVMLQSGGGHVLLLAPATDIKAYSEDLLRKMRQKFVKELGGWAPLLYASWEDDGVAHWKPLTRKTPDEIIRALSTEYDSPSEEKKRGIAGVHWAAFKYGQDGKTDDEISEAIKEGRDEDARFYLDVIGLGEYCWPKPQDPSVDNGIGELSGGPNDWPDPSDWGVPSRPRAKAISGFKNSRKITPVIESTFGLIFAKHRPSHIEAMGGDEMIFQMPSSEWKLLLERVEKHCIQLHSTIFDNDQRLLWWAICLRDRSNQDFTAMKDGVRTLMGEDRVRLTRFVNPIFPEFLVPDDPVDDVLPDDPVDDNGWLMDHRARVLPESTNRCPYSLTHSLVGPDEDGDFYCGDCNVWLGPVFECPDCGLDGEFYCEECDEFMFPDTSCPDCGSAFGDWILEETLHCHECQKEYYGTLWRIPPEDQS